MASIVRNRQRGFYAVQWRDATGWKRKKVASLPPGVKDFPKRDPAEVVAALLKCQGIEDAARDSRGPTASQTVAGFLAAYLDFYATARRPASVVQLRLASARFAEWCQAEKLKYLSEITPAACDRFVTSRRKVVSHASVRREVGVLAGAWSRAVKLRELPESPWRSVTVPGSTTRRKSSWTADEVDKLRAACKPWLRDVVTLGCNTGLRATALIRLEWRDVKWNAGGGPGLGSIVVRPELDKAKDGYEVPMSAECHDLLARLSLARGDNPFVLPSFGGKGIGDANGLGKAIHKACRKAGLPKPDSPCHAMRRTFGRWAVLGTLTGRPTPVYVVSRWLGHHSVNQTEEYLDLSERASQEWMTGATPPATPRPA